MPHNIARTNPWKRTSSRIVYSNDWFRVREDRVIRPDGQSGIYGVVELPLSAGVLAIDAKRRVLLVGQWRYPNSEFSWEVPTGSFSPGETALHAAKRELLEEVGLRARRWRGMGRIANSNGATTDVAHIFLATDLVGRPRRGDEIAAFRWIPFAQALRWVMRGVITESTSVAAILKVHTTDSSDDLR